MPWTVRVRNLQSIEDVTVVIDGFTVITGPNNSGKSALMRAIRGVFNNAPAGPLVRHGASHLTVDLDLGDGNTVKWEKGPKINQYTLNGKVLENVGRGCPPEVLALGVQPMRAGADTLWPQIADQFRGVLFLIGSPGSAVAEAVADVERVGKLTSALKLAESDRRSATTTLAVRRKDVEILTEQFGEFAGLEEVEAQVAQLEAQTSEIRRVAGTRVLLAGLRSRRDAHTSVVTSLAGVQNVAVPGPDQVSQVRDLGKTLADLVRIRAAMVRSAQEVRALSGVSEVAVPVGGDAGTIRSTLEGYRALFGRLVAARLQEQRAGNAAAVAVGIVLPDAARAAKMNQASKRLREFYSRWRTAASAVTAATLELAALEPQIAQAVAEVERLAVEVETCPTCGQVWDHLHKGAA